MYTEINVNELSYGMGMEGWSTILYHGRHGLHFWLVVDRMDQPDHKVKGVRRK